MEADKEFSLDIDVDILPNSGREVVIGELFRLGWQRWIIIYPTPHADPRCRHYIYKTNPQKKSVPRS